MTQRKSRSREGWTRVRFGDIADHINDRVDDPKAAGVDRYVGLEHLDPGSLRITRWGSPDEVSAQKLRFSPGDIIFGKRRAYQRKVAVADFEGICSAHAMVLRERSEALAPGFLAHFISSDVFMERAVQISVGSLSPTINWSTLREQEFDLPPVEEQEKYVAVAATTDVLADSTTLLRRAAVRLRESYLSKSFGWSGVDALIFGAFSVPPSWQLLSLPQIVAATPNALTAGPFGTIFKAKDFRDAGVPIIQLRHITPEGLDCEGNMTYMDVAVHQRLHTAYTVVPGDLLLTKMGEPPGLACIYPAGLPDAMVTPDVIKVTLEPRIIHSSFAPWIFNNPRARTNIARLCKGGTRTRVSLGELYKLKWPVPPLFVQLQMIEVLESIALAIRSPTREKAMANIKAIFSHSLAPTG